MKLKLIYPKWPKLKNQPEFNLPPHGPVCFAAALPNDVELTFCDENVEVLTFDDDVDLICLSVMLTCQIPRAWEIADRYRVQYPDAVPRQHHGQDQVRAVELSDDVGRDLVAA